MATNGHTAVIMCLCSERGYCADVPGDPLACPQCVRLGPYDDCPADRLYLERDAIQAAVRVLANYYCYGEEDLPRLETALRAVIRELGVR